jgi:uncharacterized protein (DUF1015 family)
MATVRPFRGLHYARRWRPQLSRLVTPPYDIISPRQQQQFYRQHPDNIIRLEYGRTRDTDTPADNRYTRARATLRDWVAQGVLALETKPAFYLLRTHYRDPAGVTRHFTGLLGRVKLEPLGAGSILPHEHTFLGPKVDRLNLLIATGVSFSPVFALYRGSGTIRELLERRLERRAEVAFTDWSGTRHELWTIQDTATTAALSAAFRRQTLLIADGHHRYATALTFQKRYRRQVGPAADHVMMCLAQTADPGLMVWPVCRLVTGVPASRWRKFHAALERQFSYTPVAALTDLTAAQRQAAAAGQVVLATLGYPGRGPGLLRSRSSQAAEWIRRDLPKASARLRALDVVLLEHIVLKRCLGIPPGDEAGRITFTKDLTAARRAVARGSAQAAFVPGPPRLDAIWAIAQGGETMPQKSTYFLPKLITGLVLNPVALDCTLPELTSE